MKFFATLSVFFSVVLVCHATGDDENIVSVNVDANINLHPALELVDSLSRAIFNTFQASTVAVKKHLQELGKEAKDDVIDPVIRAVEKPISYIGKEVNEVAQDFRGVIDYIDGVVDGTIQTFEDIPPEMLHRVGQIWGEIQTTANKLSRDIQQYRKFIINKITALEKKYGEDTAEFHEAMKILCLEVENRCFFAFKRAESAFRKALTLPQLDYFSINLQAWFENWEAYLHLHAEAPIDEVMREARNLWKTIFNAVQVRFYLDIFSDINPELWPCNALAWQDMTNVKELFDRSVTKLEFYVNTSLQYINKLQEKDRIAAQAELHRLNDEAKKMLDHLIDFTRIPFTKAYEVSTRRQCFEPNSYHVRYDSALQRLLAYLSQNGCKIHLYPREFAPITDRLSMGRSAQSSMHRTYSINTNAGTLHPGRTIYDYLRAVHGPDYDFGIEEQITTEVNISVHAFLLHDHVINEIKNCGKNVLRDLKPCLSKRDFYGRLIYLQFREEMKIFMDSISYLKLYIAQAVFYTDTNFEPWSPAYTDALNNLDTDVRYRLNVLASRLLHAFEYTISYKNYVCEQRPIGPIPPNGYTEETPMTGYETPTLSPANSVTPQSSAPNEETYTRSSTDNFEDVTTTVVATELPKTNSDDLTTSQLSPPPPAQYGQHNMDANTLPQTANLNGVSPPSYETPEINPHSTGNRTEYVSAPSGYTDQTPPLSPPTENTDAYLLPQTANPHGVQNEHPMEDTQTPAFETYVVKHDTAVPENTDAYFLPQTANPDWRQPPSQHYETHGTNSVSPPQVTPQSSKDAYLLPETTFPPSTSTGQTSSATTTYTSAAQSSHVDDRLDEGPYLLPQPANDQMPSGTHASPPAYEYPQLEGNTTPITSPRSIESTVPPQSPYSNFTPSPPIINHPGNEHYGPPDIRTKYDNALPTKRPTIPPAVARRNYYTDVNLINNQVTVDYVSESTSNDAAEGSVVLPTPETNNYPQSSPSKNEDIDELPLPEEVCQWSNYPQSPPSKNEDINELPLPEEGSQWSAPSETNNYPQSPPSKNEDINELPPPEESNQWSAQSTPSTPYRTPPTQSPPYTQSNINPPGTGFQPPPPTDQPLYKNEDINELPISGTEENQSPAQTSDYPTMGYTSPPSTTFNPYDTAVTPPPPTSPVYPSPVQNTNAPSSTIQNPSTTPAPAPKNVEDVTNPPLPTDTNAALLTERSFSYSTSENRQTDTTVTASNSPTYDYQQEQPQQSTTQSKPQDDSQAADNNYQNYTVDEQTLNQSTTTKIISTTDGQPEPETPTGELDDDQDVQAIAHTHLRSGHTDNQHYQNDVDNDGDVDVDVRVSQTETVDQDSTVLKVTDDNPNDGVDDTTIVQETTTKHSYLSTVTSYFDNETDSPQNANT